MHQHNLHTGAQLQRMTTSTSLVPMVLLLATRLYLSSAQNLTTSSPIACDSSTMTELGIGCVFPFSYQGQTFDACTTFDDVLGRYWCATQTVSRVDDTMKTGSWAHCACENPVDLSSCTYRRNGFCYPHGCDSSGDAYIYINSTDPIHDTCVANPSAELLPLRFSGQAALSHLTASANVGFRHSNITLRLRTTTPNGILLFVTASAASSQDASLPAGGPVPNYFYCLLENGVLNFGFRIASMRLFEPVNSDVNLLDGSWHSISILRLDTVATVTIDDELPSTFSSIDGTEYFITSSADEMLVSLKLTPLDNRTHVADCFRVYRLSACLWFTILLQVTTPCKPPFFANYLRCFTLTCLKWIRNRWQQSTSGNGRCPRI